MLTAVKNLPGSEPRTTQEFARPQRRSPDVVPLALAGKTTALPQHLETRSDASAPTVALVLVIDASAKATEALERDFSSQAVELDPLNLAELLPQNSHATVQKILATLKARLSGGSSVTAIPVDLKLMLRNIHDEPALEFDAIKIDRARREVHTPAGHTLLTKGEFDLLTFLAENPGVAFSRKDLIDGCRGGDHVLDYRAIDVQIFGLRKKLGEARWHIQTVRGFGYRFVVDRPEHEIVTLRPR